MIDWDRMALSVAKLEHAINQATPPWASLIGRCELRASDAIPANGEFYVCDLTGGPGRKRIVEGTKDHMVTGHPTTIAALRVMMAGCTDDVIAAVLVHRGQVKRLDAMLKA